MDARQAKRGKRISLQQEKRTAASLGGRTQAASGALPMGGGADVRVLGKTRVECKFTEKSQFALKFAELRKLQKQAIKCLEVPVFQFAFRHVNGKFTQFVAIQWITEDKPPPDNTHCWYTSAKQITFTESQLEKALATGRIQFTWLHAGLETLEQRRFEIMRWADYEERHKES